MKKTVLFILSFLYIMNLCFAQTTGDIYFIGWNADGNDDILFITFVDIDGGTIIYFRDDEYNNGWIDENEGCFSWTCQAGGINAGDVIQIYDCINNPPTASAGTCTFENASFNISGSEDAVYAYTSTTGWNSGTYTFLAAFCHQINFNSDLLNGTGLTDNINAWSWDSNKDNWRYTGSRTGVSVAAVKTLIQNSSNWEYTDGGGDQSFTFSLTDFILPVNLSSFYALYISGTPTLYWTTQTETDNAYWNVYRGTNNDFEEAALINANNPVAGNGTTNNSSDYIYTDVIPVVQNTTYWYWIEDVSTDGETEVHEPINLSIPFEDTPVTPEDYGLHQNYPNPFNPSTSISFALDTESDVELIIYNVKGEKIKSIFNDHIYADQISTAVWDGKDANGKDVSTGVYFYKLITDTKEYQKKMLMVK